MTDSRAICEALGFDPTNHHNAAACPYCTPDAEPAILAALKDLWSSGVCQQSVEGQYDHDYQKELDSALHAIRQADPSFGTAEASDAGDLVAVQIGEVRLATPAAEIRRAVFEGLAVMQNDPTSDVVGRKAFAYMSMSPSALTILTERLGHGARDLPDEFEAWWATHPHRNREPADYNVKKAIAFSAFHYGTSFRVVSGAQVAPDGAAS